MLLRAGLRLHRCTVADAEACLLSMTEGKRLEKEKVLGVELMRVSIQSYADDGWKERKTEGMSDLGDFVLSCGVAVR